MAKKKVARKKVGIEKAGSARRGVKGAERGKSEAFALKLGGPEGHASSAWCTQPDSGGRFT